VIVLENNGTDPWPENTKLMLHTRGEHSGIINSLFAEEIPFNEGGQVQPGDIVTATIRLQPIDIEDLGDLPDTLNAKF